MKTIHKIVMLYLLLMPMLSLAETKEIPFTLEDRDRIIRTEQKLDALSKQLDGLNSRMESVGSKVESVNSRMESVGSRTDSFDSRLDQLFNFLWVITSIFTAMTISVFGFAFWDRKISLSPMKNENKRIISVLIEFSKFEPKLQESLRKAGIL